MSQQFYDEFYAKYYRDLHEIDKRIGSLDDYFVYQYKRAEETFGNAGDEPNKEVNILEIGCSSGGILQFFKDRGRKVQGIDLDPKYVEYAQKKGLDVTVDTVDTVELKQRPTYVIMSHVLEHLLDPIRTLKRIREIMHPMGWLLIEVPGTGNLLKYDMDFTKTLQLAHVYYFSQDTLRKLLQRAGFSISYMTEDIQALCQPLHMTPDRLIYEGKSASITSYPKGQSTPRMIAGHARSGTMYMAYLLQALGIDMKHQELGKDGVVSWQHICTNEYKVSCDEVIHQVRHPLKVIASTAYTLHPCSYPFMFDCIGTPPNDHPLVVAMWTWLKWNELIEERAKWRFKIEDCDVTELEYWLGIEFGKPIKPNIPKTTNSIPHPETSWQELEAVDLHLCEQVRALGKKYGYE